MLLMQVERSVEWERISGEPTEPLAEDALTDELRYRPPSDERCRCLEERTLGETKLTAEGCLELLLELPPSRTKCREQVAAVVLDDPSGGRERVQCGCHDV
jgi:hypothetical protein